MSATFFVYILASRIGGTLYIGVTNDLLRRISEHRAADVAGFTKKYGVSRLVSFEVFEDIEAAIAREKQLKGWNRAWKVRLIEKDNPNWNDLYPALLGGRCFAPSAVCCSAKSARILRRPGVVYWVPFPRPAFGRSRRG